MNLCACGCGQDVGLATYTIRSKGITKGHPFRFLNGHTSRTPRAIVRQAAMENVNPNGLCMCGCGSPAPLATKTRYERGQVKGRPIRFIRGHSRQRSKQSEDARRRISAALRTRIPSEETRRKLSESKQGHRNPNWKGGKGSYRNRTWVFVGQDHPMSNSLGWCFEHRLVMAGVLGRMLASDEHVHHLDLDQTNNAPENLVILSPSQHSRLHRLIDWHSLSPLDALARVVERTRV